MPKRAPLPAQPLTKRRAAPHAGLFAALAAAVFAFAAAAADLVDGEVRKVDKEAAKVTLKHGEIKSLDMPAMTMVFTVKDKALLDKVKTGDRVKFRAVNEGGRYTVTEMQMVP